MHSFEVNGDSPNPSDDFDTARQINERLCYVEHDLAVERRLALKTTVLVQPFQLLDGRIIKVGRQRFEATGDCFDPDKTGADGMYSDHLDFGVRSALFVRICDVDDQVVDSTIICCTSR